MKITDETVVTVCNFRYADADENNIAMGLWPDKLNINGIYLIVIPFTLTFPAFSEK